MNRGNGRMSLFRTEQKFAALQKVLGQVLQFRLKQDNNGSRSLKYQF